MVFLLGLTLAGCSTGAPKASSTAEYKEVEHGQLTSGAFVSELSGKRVKVRATFYGQNAALLPDGYASGRYLAFQTAGADPLRAPGFLIVVAPKTMANTIFAATVSETKLIISGRAAPVLEYNATSAVLGRPTKTLIIEAHRIEIDTTSDQTVTGPATAVAPAPESITTRPAPPQAGDLNGTFVGEITNQQLVLGVASGQTSSLRVTFAIVQSGDQITGIWTTTSGASGTISGTVKGQVINSLSGKQVDPCNGDFKGAAFIAGNGILAGTFVGTDCKGTYMSNFRVTRQ